MRVMPQLPLADAVLDYQPRWLPAEDADALFAELRRTIPWSVHRIRMFGREVPSPRLSCWIGDSGAAYRYSGTTFQPHAWPAVLQPIRARLGHELEIAFNSVLLNLYRDGGDSMGWHRDDEPELGPEPVVASLSLGAHRRFVLKSLRDPGDRAAIELEHGSLLVMPAGTQRHYRHALPKTARPVGERINLTFRDVLVGAASRR